MSGTRPAGRHVRPAQAIRTLGLLLAGLLLLAACFSRATPLPTFQPAPVPSTTPFPTPEPTTNPTTNPTANPTVKPTVNPTDEGGGGLVIPALVGSWTQDGAGMSTGYFLRSTYTFDPDGNYSLVDQLCLTTTNGTTCQPDDSPEAGVAAVNNDQLLLSPTTASDLGVRTYTFAITPDEVTGYNDLLFFMPDYVDEWFWVPD